MANGTVLMLVGPEYEDLEVWYPKLRLEEAGYEVKLAGLGEREYRGKHGYPCKPDGTVRDFPAAGLVGSASARFTRQASWSAPSVTVPGCSSPRGSCAAGA